MCDLAHMEGSGDGPLRRLGRGGRERARLELERQMRPYRRARKTSRSTEGGLRAVRPASGIPAEQVARVMECDMVYGLAPWSRSLEHRAMWGKRFARKDLR